MRDFHHVIFNQKVSINDISLFMKGVSYLLLIFFFNQVGFLDHLFNQIFLTIFSTTLISDFFNHIFVEQSLMMKTILRINEII